MRRRWINLLQWFGLAPPTRIVVSTGSGAHFRVGDLLRLVTTGEVVGVTWHEDVFMPRIHTFWDWGDWAWVG